jgi:hypothetical protein
MGGGATSLPVVEAWHRRLVPGSSVATDSAVAAINGPSGGAFAAAVDFVVADLVDLDEW